MGEAEVGGTGAPGDKGPGEAAPSPAEETVVWSPEVEVCLFHAMLGHKPVGERRAAPRTRVGVGRANRRADGRAEPATSPGMGPPISGCRANPRPHDFPAREALALGPLLSLRHSYPRECLHSPRPCTPLDLDPPSVCLVLGTPTCLVTLLSPLTPDSCNPPPAISYSCPPNIHALCTEVPPGSLTHCSARQG